MNKDIKDSGKTAITSLVLIIINEVSKGINELIKDNIESAFKNIKDRNTKYNLLEEQMFYSLTETKLVDIQKAIVECNIMSNLINNNLKNLNTYNPVDKIKFNYLIKEQQKWRNLGLYISVKKTIRLKRELEYLYHSKRDNGFFEGFSGIPQKVLSFETNAQFDNLILELSNYNADTTEQG